MFFSISRDASVFPPPRGIPHCDLPLLRFLPPHPCESHSISWSSIRSFAGWCLYPHCSPSLCVVLCISFHFSGCIVFPICVRVSIAVTCVLSIRDSIADCLSFSHSAFSRVPIFMFPFLDSPVLADACTCRWPSCKVGVWVVIFRAIHISL